MSVYGLQISGVVLRWKIPHTPPEKQYLGGVLRGILGHSLFGEVCPYDQTQCENCVRIRSCHYPLIFKPIEPDELAAYVLHDWKIEDNHINVTLLFFNQAYQGIESWIKGLKYQLPLLEWFGKTGMALFSVKDWQTGKAIFSRNRFVKNAQVTTLKTLSPVSDSQRVIFRTPLLTKHQHDDPLFSALRTRLQRLRLQFGDGQHFELDNVTVWQCNVLKKVKTVFELGGKRRVCAYYYDLQLSTLHEEAKILLALGSLLHVGGQTSFGLGHYTLEN